MRYKTTVITIRRTPSSLPTAPCYELGLSNGTTVFAHALVWAAGFGTEKCEITNQRLPGNPVKLTGIPFWGNDLLEAQGMGVATSNPQIAILGGGDGAIQDALRALTKERSAADIYLALNLPPDFGRDVLEAEAQAHRHWIWAGRSGRRDHNIHVYLDRIHRSAAADALAIPAVRAAAEALIPYPDEEVVVYHRCDHLVCFYALNRFLAHLFDALLRSQQRRGLLVGNSSVVDANSTGSKWDLDVVDDPVCYQPISLASPSRSELADDVVVRFGIDPSTAAPPWPLKIDLTRNRHSYPSNPVPL